MADPGPGSALSVVHLCAPAHVGGLERVVQGLTMGQVERGHRVRAVAVVEAGAEVEPFVAPMRDAGVEVVVEEMGARAYLREVAWVRGRLKRWRPDVLHTHGYRSDLLHGWMARRLGIATVSTLHGSSRMGGASQLFEWIQEWALGGFDGVVAVSEPLVDDLEAKGVPRERIHMVPNAWTPPSDPLDRPEAREVLQVAGDQVVLGWVGRLIPVKGCDVFVEALARLPGDGWVARVVGDGPERQALEARSHELGLEDRLRFLGAIPDAARLFAGVDLFALSSRSEGTPMVLLEAMGVGVPVVATRVGGVPGVLRAPSEGWLVPPEDPDALAEALGEAVTGGFLRTERGEAGRRRIAEEYSFSIWIRRHAALYRAAMEVRAARG